MSERRALASISKAKFRDLGKDLLYVVGTEEHLYRVVEELADIGVDRVHFAPAGANPERTFARLQAMLPNLQAIRSRALTG